MKNKVIFMLLMTSIGSLSLAQGYLIKTNGDSLTGKVNIVRNSLGQEYVQVKTGKDKQTVDILKTRKIVTQKGETIEPLLINGEYYFAKRIKKGYLNHYKYTPKGTVEPFVKDILYKLDGSYIELAGVIGFRNQVANFLTDCSAVAYAVKRREYARKDLGKIIEDYNRCMENKPLAYAEGAGEGPGQERTADKVQQKGKQQDRFADFRTLLRYSDKVSNKDDISEMFNDLVKKMEAGEEVPNYLTAALKDAVKGAPMLKDLLEKILSHGNNERP